MASASFFETKKWKNLMSKLYGFGAALVIIGALFKLQHWPGAGYMLSVGMLTEFVIFIFSAFEPLPVDYKWENVWPETLDKSLSGNAPTASKSKGFSGPSIDPALSEELTKSVERFNQSIKSMNALSTIGEATNAFAGGVQQAAGQIGGLNQSMQGLQNAYQQAADSLTEGGKQSATAFNTLNTHLTAVNASYEIYLQQHKQYVSHSDELVSSMKQSATQSTQFSENVQQLSSRVSELNAVYGSMLSTVNTALKK